MTPAEILRAAADRLDELAGKATKDVCPEWVASAVRHINRNCDIVCWHGDDPNPECPDDGQDHDGWSRYDDAPWISLMDAKVAAPLSAWLRAAAAACDEYDALADPDSHISRMCADSDNVAGSYRHTAAFIRGALDFARTVLGQTAPSPTN